MSIGHGSGRSVYVRTIFTKTWSTFFTCRQFYQLVNGPVAMQHVSTPRMDPFLPFSLTNRLKWLEKSNSREPHDVKVPTENTWWNQAPHAPVIYSFNHTEKGGRAQIRQITLVFERITELLKLPTRITSLRQRTRPSTIVIPCRSIPPSRRVEVCNVSELSLRSGFICKLCIVLLVPSVKAAYNSFSTLHSPPLDNIHSGTCLAAVIYHNLNPSLVCQPSFKSHLPLKSHHVTLLPGNIINASEGNQPTASAYFW